MYARMLKTKNSDENIKLCMRSYHSNYVLFVD